MIATCPNDDELVRLVEGALGDPSLAALEAHTDQCERCAAVIAELGAMAAPATSPKVGRYQLDRRIAAGGMGEVWAAWDPELRRELAVKLVRPDRADDGRERERLLREARALARLTHPNVLAVYDVGEVDGQVFIATELVAGDTLASRGGANADWRTVARLYVQAARGLAAAHAAGLVHRDVKPANLLVGADHRVRVADFGLAVRSRTPVDAAPGTNPRESSVTATGAIAGTPAYMAPEQRAGIPADARADQFAFAVALGEAIAGRRPVADASADDLVALVAERRAPEPELDALCAAIARGLAIDPTERHADMTAFADAIEATVAVAAAPAPARRRRGAGLVAVAAFAAAGGGLAIWLATRDAGSGASLETGAPTRVAATGGADSQAARVATQPGTATPGVAPPTITSAPSTQPAGDDLRPSTPTADASAQPRPASTHPTGDVSARPRPASTQPDRPGAAPRTQTIATAPSTQPAGDASSTRPGTVPPMPTTARTPPGSPRPTTTITPGTTPPTRDASPGADDAPRDDDRHIAAAPDPAAPPPAPTASPPPTPRVDPAPNLAEVDNAIRRHDGPACRAALLRIPPSTNIRYLFSHAYCEMTAGNCEGGTRELEAALTRQGVPTTSAPYLADQVCPVGTDPAARLRRLAAQTGRLDFDCLYYVAPARAAAAAATTDADRHTAGVVLATIARCLSSKGRCDDARAMLRDAQRMIPALDQYELAAACR